MTPPFDVVDTHVHLYPDRIAEKVTDALGRKFGNPPMILSANARRLLGIEGKDAK